MHSASFLSAPFILTDFVVKHVHLHIFLFNIYRIECKCVESYYVSNDNDWQFRYEIEPVDDHQVQRHQEHLDGANDVSNDDLQHDFNIFLSRISWTFNTTFLVQDQHSDDKHAICDAQRHSAYNDYTEAKEYCQQQVAFLQHKLPQYPINLFLLPFYKPRIRVRFGSTSVTE